LRHWLTTRASIRPSTLRSYTQHVQRHLIPHLGRIRLGDLKGRDVAAMFAVLAATDTTPRRTAASNWAQRSSSGTAPRRWRCPGMHVHLLMRDDPPPLPARRENRLA